MAVQTANTDAQELLREGKAAATRGEKETAQSLLSQAVELEPHNEEGWLWLSGVVAGPQEQQICLENVLVINPYNVQARKNLEQVAIRTGVAPRIPPVPSEYTSPLSPELAGYIEAAEPISANNPSSGLPAWMQTDANLEHATESWAMPPSTPTPAEPAASFQDPFGAPSWEPDGNQAADMNGRAANPWDSELSFDVEPFLPPTAAVVPKHAASEDAPVYTGGPPRQGLPPDTGAAMPGWVTDDGGGTAGGVSPAQGNAFNASAQSGAPMFNGDPSQVPVNAHGELGDWLGLEQQVPSSFITAAENRAMSPSVAAQPMDPYSDMQLPSPSQLPGTHGEADSLGRPWYAQTASGTTDNGTATPHAHFGGGPSAFDHGQGIDFPEIDDLNTARISSAPPVAMLDCPNCKASVPETALACSKCRFNFFVNCPHCHELIDTSDARWDVTEPCPYCRGIVNKMELGLIGSKGPAVDRPAPAKGSTEAHPNMNQFAPAPVRSRRGIGWVLDVVWLVMLVAIVWALTQLPAWLHLTGIY